MSNPVVELIQRLVRTPSRGGVDDYEPILRLLEEWAAERGLPMRRLLDDGGGAVGLAVEVGNRSSGRHLVLDACIDTAPYGDQTAWRFHPSSGRIHEGWLYGRGSSDSKAAAAIFLHLAAELRASEESLPGRLTVLLDADEHTGRFAGARSYFEDAGRGPVDGVMIGYPGQTHVGVGARGFLRAEMVVHGTAGHTGARNAEPGNAVAKAARLTSRLTDAALPGVADERFPLPPKLTVTAIRGGEGYSIVPDRCLLLVDVRLTPAFPTTAAEGLLARLTADVDRTWPTARATTIAPAESWPAYRLPARSALVEALATAASAEGGQPVEPKVTGPSNIGNYLAALGIEATCGYGVSYRNLHATDECIDVRTVAPVHRAYRAACRSFLGDWRGSPVR